jgi:sulfur carrier protein
MEILLNDKPQQFPDRQQLTAEELVALSYPNSQKGIALAIGDRVIPKDQWAETIIYPQDKVLLFKATQGG